MTDYKNQNKSEPDQSHCLVSTGDETLTLYSREFDENMHSISGAYEEALLKHVLPSRLFEKRKAVLRILDIGFGLGYNILALIYSSRAKRINSRIEIISLEKDQSYSFLMDSIHFDQEKEGIYDTIRQAFRSGVYTSADYSIRLLYGDARHLVKTIDDPGFDAVFHDPFSPAKNPELWTVQFFHELFKRMNQDAILTTYSSAIHVRSAMLESGFLIGRGPSVGKKKEGTVAVKEPIIDLIPSREIESIKNDIRSVPFQDKDFSKTREEIRENRKNEMAVKKIKPCPEAHQ